MDGRIERKNLAEAIYADHAEIKREFVSRFRKDIEKFIDSLFAAYDKFKKIDENINGCERKAYVAAFVYNSIYNLALSFNLLLLGHLLASGNLFRQHIESSLMAVLLSRTDLVRC